MSAATTSDQSSIRARWGSPMVRSTSDWRGSGESLTAGVDGAWRSQSADPGNSRGRDSRTRHRAAAPDDPLPGATRRGRLVGDADEPPVPDQPTPRRRSVLQVDLDARSLVLHSPRLTSRRTRATRPRSRSRIRAQAFRLVTRFSSRLERVEILHSGSKTPPSSLGMNQHFPIFYDITAGQSEEDARTERGPDCGMR
jgi:hypothetical protein